MYTPVCLTCPVNSIAALDKGNMELVNIAISLSWHIVLGCPRIGTIQVASNLSILLDPSITLGGEQDVNFGVLCPKHRSEPFTSTLKILQ